jgi:hypothetical protein
MNVKKPNNIIPVGVSQQQNQQNIPVQTQKIDTELEEQVLLSKTKQFNFDCKVFMAKIDVRVKSPFGLYWHAKKSNSLDEFISSVESYIKLSDNTLTDGDKVRLTSQYDNFKI